MNNTIYIAGKYTGLGHANAVAKFDDTKQKLIAAGYNAHHIVVPTEVVPEGTIYELAMEICIANMQRCGAVLMQYDWRESQGAIREYERATELCKPVFYEDQDGIEAAAAWHATETQIAQLFLEAAEL